MDLTAIGTLLTGVGTVATAAIGMNNRRGIKETKHLVNGHTTELDNRVVQLTAALTDADIEVPNSPKESQNG
jgi:hypothetical protein